MGFVGLEKQARLKRQVRELEAEKALLFRFIDHLQRQVHYSDYLFENNIQRFAVYGCNEYSNLLFEQLRQENRKIEYIITGNLNVCSKDIKLLTMEDKLPEVDAIIICELFYEDEIKEKLIKKGFHKIITFADMVYQKL